MATNYLLLDLPDGLRSDGTLYKSRGNWVACSRVRWANNALRPIGGWNRFTNYLGEDLDPVFSGAPYSGEVAHAIKSWKAIDGSNLFAVATNAHLTAFSRTQDPTDITPVDFTPRPVEIASMDGYGGWYYGKATYGTARPDDVDNATAFRWCLRNWGQNLLAAPRGAPSKLYQWDTSFAAKATALSNAPQDFDCFHVTDQRIVMVAGSPSNPRLVQWSTSENNNQWTPAVTNQAGSMTLDGVGRFREIVTVQDQYLLVSDDDAYVSRYLGPPYIYGFDQVGVNCGTIAGPAVVSVEDFAVWPGDNCFFVFDGSSVRRLDCPCLEAFLEDRNDRQTSKMVGFANPHWPEVWWLYQSSDNEIDSYIFFNWKDNTWSMGRMDRTCGGGNASTGGLLMVGQNLVYSHEQEGAIPIESAMNEIFAETGPIELAKGDKTQFVSSIQPDFVADGTAKIYLIGQDRPGGPETVFGPYIVTYPSSTKQPIPTRARGHTVRVRIEAESGNWTLGTMRLNFKYGGEK